MVVVIRSYPELVEKIREEEGSYAVRYKYGSKKKRLAYARQQDWSYKPPTKYGTNQPVTEFETKKTDSGTISIEEARKPTERTYKPQTQSTIDKLKTGELKTKENVYMVKGEVALSQRTAQAVAEYKRQQEEQRQEKQHKEFIQSVQEDTRKRFSKEWDRKKEEAKKESELKTSKEKDVSQNIYYTPERKKSPQETMDVTTSLDLKQYMKLSDTIPQNVETKDTFRGVELITKETLKQSKQEGFLAHWGTFIDYKEQELLKGAEFKSSKSTKTINEMISLSGSTESITPTEYKTRTDIQTETIKENKLTIKETANVLIAPAFFGVARGGKNVVYGLVHPVDTISSIVMLPFMIPEVVSHIAKKGAVNPIGTVTELTTELYLWGKVSKAVHRIAKPKIFETPIKAKNIKILETIRKTKSGKTVKDVHVSVTTVKGKTTSRYFWQKPKTQPRKVINVDFKRKGTSIHKGGIKQTETFAHIKGTIKLKDGGKKLKFIPKESTIKGKPTTQYNLDSAYSGKTSAGTPLRGKTPKIKAESGVHILKQTRKGYEYKTADTVRGIYKNGEFFTVTKSGKWIKVPQKSFTKVQAKGTQTYSSKRIQTGELVGEIQHTGSFVKRKYISKPKVIKTKQKYDIEISNKGKIKVLDTKKFPEFHYTESGKLIRTGKKPISPTQQKILNKISEKSKTSQSTKLISLKKSSQVSKGKLKTVSPVVKVISKNAKSKGVFILSSPLEKTQKNKQKSEIITREELLEEPSRIKIINPVFDSINKSDVDNSFKFKSIDSTKTDQVFESVFDSDNKQKLDNIIGLKEDTISEQRFISANPQIVDPVIDIKIKQKQIIPPLILSSPNDVKKQSEKEEKGYNTYMYEGGKQVKANLSPLPKAEAERLGRDVADNSLSASYRVSKTNKNVPSSKRSKLATGGYVSPSKFTQSKSEKRRGFSIEKRRNRLDTFGERNGIKASKLLAERKKSISNNIFGKSNKNNRNNKGGKKWLML